MSLMATSPTVIPFETVATFHDKKNNNVCVNIALHPLTSRLSMSKSTSINQFPTAGALRHRGMTINPVASVEDSLTSTPSKASLASPTSVTSEPSSASTASKPLRVDKSTITDPEEDEYEDVCLDEITAPNSDLEARRPAEPAKQSKSRLSSVLESLKNVFQWRHSIVGSRRNSESIVDNGNAITTYNPDLGLPRDNLKQPLL